MYEQERDYGLTREHWKNVCLWGNDAEMSL